MEKSPSSCNCNPTLYEKYIHKSYLYRAYTCLHLLLLLSFLTHRLLHLLDEFYGLLRIIAFCCEIWFSFQWVLYHNLRWVLVEYKAYPEKLASRYSGYSSSKLSPVDIIITTTDHFKEPAVLTANTVLSVLALDYPVKNFAYYVSWNYDIESRVPFMYFSKKPKSSDPNFLQQWDCVKDYYENIKRRIAKALETGQVPLDSVSGNGVNGFVYKSSDIRNHSSIAKVIHENKAGQGNEGVSLPHQIYVSREKRPEVNHQYKAGAMNVTARVSGVMTNASFILNLDCDMYVCNPKVIQHAAFVFRLSFEKKMLFYTISTVILWSP